MAEFDPEQFGKAFKDFAEKMQGAIEPLTRNLNSQAAVGNILNGDIDAAGAILKRMPDDHLRELSAAALALKGLADKELAT
jgi:hypothetical protein